MLLKNINRRNQFAIIQIKPIDFLNFAKYSKICFEYKAIPFCKVKILKFNKYKFVIEYSCEYDTNMTKGNIRKEHRTRRNKSKVSDDQCPMLQDIEFIKSENTISQDKKKDLMTMFKYMSEIDKEYYKVILKLGNLN